jgi:hypothetical protein
MQLSDCSVRLWDGGGASNFLARARETSWIGQKCPGPRQEEGTMLAAAPEGRGSQAPAIRS